MFKTVEEAIYYVEHIKRKDKRKDLSRIKYLLNLLNNPQNDYKKIHIAGTNGKGATCEMITSILYTKGYRVARFVSPYILRFNERIVVNNKEIDDESLLNIINYLYPIINKYNTEFNDIVPFFEVVTLIGFIYFSQMKVDYAVIECGLGGLLDATNVINASVSIITSIGYDHMNVLGNTLEEISLNKLGIVKENNHLITAVDKSLYSIFSNYCKTKNATVDFISILDKDIFSSFNGTKFRIDNEIYYTNLVGSFEALNAKLAIKACQFIDKSITKDIIDKALSNIFWPGRMEVLSTNPLVILDGGHNISAVDTVVNSLNKLSNIKYNVLYTGLSDKETDKVIKCLEKIANKIIITSIDDPRCKDINQLFNEVSIDKIKISNEFEAFDYAYNLNEPLLIIGSLHFVSSLRPYILNKLKDIL